MPDAPLFELTPRGRRGYDPGTVDAHVARTAAESAAHGVELVELRAEVERLHRYIRGQWATDAGRPPSGRPGAGGHDPGDRTAAPAAQARQVIADAQAEADRRLAAAAAREREAERTFSDRLDLAEREAAQRLAAADAECAARLAEAERLAAARLASADGIAHQVVADADRRADGRLADADRQVHRMLVAARGRYEQVVVRAHDRADRAAATALHDVELSAARSDDPARARAALELKAAYLRTFAQVSRTALDAVLVRTVREFDALLAPSADSPAPVTNPVPLPAASSA